MMWLHISFQPRASSNSVRPGYVGKYTLFLSNCKLIEPFIREEILCDGINTFERVGEMMSNQVLAESLFIYRSHLLAKARIGTQNLP